MVKKLSLKEQRFKEKHKKRMKKIKRVLKRSGTINSLDIKAFSDKLKERMSDENSGQAKEDS